MANRNVARAVRMALFAAGAAGAGMYAPGALAQDPQLEQIVVTGSRIARQDFIANSPIASVSQEQIVGNADVTLDTFLNTLPQVNPAGGTTSNNPGNNGQSNIDLRGLGSNRNIVLIDGRRPMVSANDLTVDLNTIPAAMIESIEVITGGAGATYGADAISGAVNIRLKKNFEGADIRGTYSNATDSGDGEETSYSFVVGGLFNEGRGHALLGYENASREAITKGAREFSAFATSTTGTPPQGVLRWAASNPVSLAAVQQVFGQYGVAPNLVTNQSGLFGFNRDGTMIYYGVPTNPTLNAQNFRDPIDVSVNQRFYPDFYSYNFDAPNLLVLPLERDSFMADLGYETESGIEFFGQVAWTQYTSAQALAPAPVPTPATRALGQNSAVQVGSALVTPGASVTGSLVIPTDNPFITPDLRTLLDSRVGDNPSLVGAGRNRGLPVGLPSAGVRPASVELHQHRAAVHGRRPWPVVLGQLGLGGLRLRRPHEDREPPDRQRRYATADRRAGSPAHDGWRRLRGLESVPRQHPDADECIDYLSAVVSSQTELKQEIIQGFIRGDIFEMPAGDLSVVLGAESRRFNYDFFYNGTPGPFSGFNVGDPDGGKNSFMDYFAEALIPIARDLPFIASLDLSLGYRSSTSEFKDTINNVKSDENTSDAYKVELSYAPITAVRLRASYQKSIREPNFGELFQSSTSFPQIFDPCSSYSNLRNGPDAAAVRQLCIDTGVAAGVVDTFVASPGGQAQTVTDGNTDLQAEEADTYTIGGVFLSESDNQWLSRLRGSLDYYNIEISDALIQVDTNGLIADCFNYTGNNPSYDIEYAPCTGMFRSGGTILAMENPSDPNGYFQFENQGTIKTSGIDVQIAYGMDLDWFGAPAGAGGLDFSLLLTHVLEWDQEGIDYTGTIPYFGAGLGQAFPEWKANFSIGYDAGPIGVDFRARYIDGMTNRVKAEFPGETFFGVVDPGPDVDSIVYMDASVSFDFWDDKAQIRVGVNNLTDEEPELYAPNVQSGTDPSTYDVVGRRAFAQLNLRF